MAGKRTYFWRRDEATAMPDVPRDEPPEDSRPWEAPGAVRRDVGPHRGRWLRLLAGTALACGVASLCLAVPALVALPLGTAVLVMARRDRARMRRGEMDPDGLVDIGVAEGWAALGVLLAIPPLAVAAFTAYRLLAEF